MNIQIPTTQQLIAAIDEFRDRHGMSQTAFGREVARDSGFLVRLNEPGKTITMKRARAIAQFMERYDAVATADANSLFE